MQVVNIGQTIVPGVVTTMRYRSQNPLNNRTRGSNWNRNGLVRDRLAQHQVRLSGQLLAGRPRDADQHPEAAGTRSLRWPDFRLTEYVSPYNVNARAMQTSLYAQDQWTINRLTLQGALRWDHPWSWFPEQVQPASRFFPGATFPKTDGVTGYNDITPRMGAAYDVFGNGKTALKVTLGKYLQGASVSNLAYGANPSLRIPGGGGGIFPPSVTRNVGRTRTAISYPDCDLNNPAEPGQRRASYCGQISDLRFGSTQLIGAQFDPDLLSGWGIRPSDWAFGVSVQQEIFPRVSVDVGYHRRVVHDVHHRRHRAPTTCWSRRATSRAFTLTAPSDARLPGGGGYPVGPLYNVNTNVFGQSSNLHQADEEVGDDTRVFDGVDVTFNVRNAKGVTFSGGTSTGKVVNDWCAIRDAVPENPGAGPTGYLLNPYCHTESPWQTAFRGLVTYTIPRIDVLVSSVFQDKYNVGTDQIVSLLANYTMTAADLAAAAAQIGRPLNTDRTTDGEPSGAGTSVWGSSPAVGFRREEGLPLRGRSG